MVRGILETMTSVPDLNIYHCQNKGLENKFQSVLLCQTFLLLLWVYMFIYRY